MARKILEAKGERFRRSIVMNENLATVFTELKDKAEERTRIPLPSDSLLERYQDEIGFQFPREYKLFLKEVMNVFYGTKDPLVVTEDGNHYGELKLALQAARELGLPRDWLPICEANGDYYCLVPGGAVRFWSHDGSSTERWSDLASWIKNVWIDGN